MNDQNDAPAAFTLHPRLTDLNPRQALNRIQLLSDQVAQVYGPADALHALETINAICADVLKAPDAEPCPSKHCSVCAVEFQFNPALADHQCTGCLQDLCPSCECCEPAKVDVDA